MLPNGVLADSYEEDKSLIRTKAQWGILIGAVVLFYVIPPFVLDAYWLSVINRWGIAIIAALGLQLLTGYAGQISIGHSAFIAVGAYTSAILTTQLGFPIWVSLPLSALSAGLIGIIFGLPSLRVKGFYLIMSTLAAQYIIMYMVTHMGLTGVQSGISAPHPSLGSIDFDTDRSFYFITITMLIICTYLAVNISRSKPGRAFVAIRDNDLAAEIMGISLFRYKLLAFFIGCFFAGIAGALTAHWIGHVSPERFSLLGSLWFLGYIIVGGMGNIAGVFFGVTLILGLTEGLSLGLQNISMSYPHVALWVAPFVNILFAVIIILFLIFEPKGLAHRWHITKAYYRLWPFAY